MNEQPQAQRARDLTPDQLSELVMRRKKKREAQVAASGSEGIVRRGVSSAPLSFAQQRLWLLDQLEPGNAAYNLGTAMRLRGELDPAVLARTLSEISRRHESLRTTFVSRDGDPIQVVAPPTGFPLPIADLTGLPEAIRDREVHRLAREDAATPFDLAKGPLARARLLALAPQEHLLIFNMHHIISDGWSFGLLFGELSTLFEAFSAGLPSPLPELPVQYTDFSLWQREWLRGATLQEQVNYWRERLQGAAPSLELPTDRVRPPLPTHRGEVAVLRLTEAHSAALREFSRRQGSTLFMTLLAAFKILLHRWAGQDDIVVGSPSAGRRLVETEGLIGFFLNTLVLRSDLSGNPTYLELLGRVRDGVLGAYRYQDVPFERLLEELQVERQLSRPPLFQVLFNMITLPELSLELRGLKLEPLGDYETLAKFDFTFYMRDSGGVINGNLVYNADLFDRDRMEALVAEYHYLLEAIVAAPETPIEALSLVPRGLAAVLPDPSRPLPVAEWPGPIHERLSLHAERHPDREMVADGAETWTYGELEARSNQLAHRLRQAGVGREDVVAIYAHRSASLAWAAMSTLKSGAAFLFLDPTYPPARLAEYLEIARPAAWLAVRGPGEAVALPPAVEEALHALPLRARFELPPLSEAAAAGLFAEQPATPPEVATGPDDLACVGFTSGSTGKPKAVLGRHAPLSQFQPWWQERFGLGEGDRFAMLSALSHDPLQRDLLTPIWLGASLRIPDPERIGEPGWLNAWAAGEQVTVVHLTPAMLEILVGGETEPRLLKLRRAFVVGDLLRRSEVSRLQRVAPAVDCVNLYGSTESQRSVSYSPVPRPGEGPAGKEALPLGRGIPGVELLVLNTAGALAGIGEVGEVYLRSRQLARGYLGDAELTGERFRTNPFRIGRFGESDPTDRIYRTGDLGRYRADGEVEFAGRADAQVKIRGFRIEPGEIEAALRRHAAVRECVVVTRGETEKRLVAYLAPAAAAVDSRELRAFLAAGLPDYMIPAAFVWLDALPMTKTGKLDRRALPEPQAEVAEESAAPATPAEELLAGIWLELLGHDRPIGLHDNFFDLGGHSLLATRVLSRIREALGVAVPLRALFEAPTIAGLAEAVERKQEEARPAAPPLVPLPRAGVKLPLSFAQQRLWILDQVEPGSFAYNLPGALRLHGDLSIEALRRAISEIVRRHEALRTVFPAHEAEAWQRILPAGDRPLPVVDLAALSEPLRTAEAGRLASEDSLRPFDLARGPLFRTLLLRMEEREHALLLSMHHIVTDGWSIGIFTRELTELYRAFAAGRPSPLPELAIQYADFSVWQRAWLQGEVLDEQLRYWSGSLKGAPPVLELPTDRPRPAAQSHRGGRRWLTLPHELTDRLGRECRHLDVTPFMALLAAFAVLLRRYSGEEDLVVGSPIANRSRRELEELIGFFANTLALRVDAAGDPSFAELARRVRHSALGAYAHQDLPFERLVDELQPQRNLNHAPIFQVMFIFQNSPRSTLELGDLSFSVLPVEEGKAQFDLTLSLMQYEGGLTGRLEYSLDLFEAATAERLMGHFGSLVTAAFEAPAARISTLPLLGDGERRELLVTHNDTWAEYPAELTVHELFEASARRRPETVAVSCGERHLSYRELDERANRLAHRLVALGVGPEVRVALCLERTPELLVAMLAVLKAGGAYLPLDPTHPSDRLGWIVEDAGAAVLVADAPSLAALPAVRGTVIDPAELDPHEAWAPPPLPATAGPENLAYVIYTSGSTGRPKGVEVRHRGVVNYLSSMARRPGLSPSDTVLGLTTLSFDIAVTELLLPLAVGARVELIDRETAGDAERLGAVMEAAGVTVMQATPATWMLLLEGGWKGRPGLKVLAGGEALPASLAERLLEVVGELWNVYGPTETTVWSTLHPVQPGDGRVSIGRPLANTSIHLLDQGGDLAPLGVAGELCIGGEGLARGYLGRPDLTAERFVPDPFGIGVRLYRTGDLARRLPGGELEFLGRIDNQVKVHGFRIELGEIEAALSRLPGVVQGVVVVRERGAGDRHLVSYLVADPAAPPSAADLRAGLKERLPEYMVPNTFVTLDALPLTPSGKVDRRSLTLRPLAGGQGLATEERELVAPRNDLEATIARVWAEVLGLPEVDVHANFFELGGDSIQGIRVVAAAKKRGVHFTPRHLFQNQTVASLATMADVERAAPAAAPRATAFQRRLLAGDPAVLPLWNEAVLIEPPAGLSAAQIETALAELSRRHEALRLRFLWHEGDWTLEVGEPVERAALERIDLVDLGPLPGDAELLVRAEEVRDRIDLGVRPWKAAVFHRGGGAPDLLLLAVHRLALDGASWQVLLEDLRSIAGPMAASEIGVPTRGLGLRHDLWSAGLSTELGVEESREILEAVTERFSCGPEAILAGALVCAASAWSGSRRVTLEVEQRRGSERAAEERRVGCFSSIALLTADAVKDPILALKRTRDELGAAPEADERTPRSNPEIALRWLGRWDAEAEGWRIRPLRSRFFHGGRTFELAARLEQGRLRLEWDYVEGFNRPEAARALAEATASALRSLLEERRSRQVEVFTVSDFPAAGLTEAGLNDLLAELALD